MKLMLSKDRMLASTMAWFGAIALGSMVGALGGCTATQTGSLPTPEVTSSAIPGSTLPATQPPDSVGSTSSPSSNAATPGEVKVSAASLQPQAYWLEAIGNKLILRPEPVVVASNAAERGAPEAHLRRSVETLLQGKPHESLSSAIPAGTELLDLEMRPGGIYVNLSKEFAEGGGSTAMIERIAQVLFTVTSTDPDRPVYFSVEGQPVDEKHPLGGEGIVLKQPITRREFAADYPLS
jgi:spore germination protein GerM